jgi:hypothetical protein
MKFHLIINYFVPVYSVSWKPNLEGIGAVRGAGGVALPSSLASSGAGAGISSNSGGSGIRFSSQPPTTSDTLEPPKQRHLHTHTTASKTVRKVYKIPATATSEAAPPLSKPKSAWSASTSKPPPGASSSGLITTSSWRAGKELREKILKGEDGEVDRGRMEYRSGGSRRRREDTSPAHCSSASESQSNLSSSQENISAVSSSSIDVHIQPERYLSESPSRAKTNKDEVWRSHGAGGALDVSEMLKDLEGSESPVPPSSALGGGGGGGGRERERVRLGQARSTTSASGGPTSKKPRYNYGEPAAMYM